MKNHVSTVINNIEEIKEDSDEDIEGPSMIQNPKVKVLTMGEFEVPNR